MPKETISIRVDDEMKQAIVAWASRQPIEMDRSGVVRYALRRLLEESGDLVQKARRSRVRKEAVEEIAEEAVAQEVTP